eukprot:10152964-Prorocentrum_lima.AAC.1
MLPQHSSTRSLPFRQTTRFKPPRARPPLAIGRRLAFTAAFEYAGIAPATAQPPSSCVLAHAGQQN